ncbi:MAG: hypothetical protein C4519_09440 [Desulfobacteraceae bacterium]|nr:MAG: hypothetical protein C4519_09440 [Desulfobacteraceae bacterium]
MRKLFCTVLLIFLMAPSPVLIAGAEVLSPGLQSRLNAAAPDAEIPVIITLADRVDAGTYRDRLRSVRRRKLVSALRSKAALKLPPLKNFLQNNSARKVRELWIINGMAAHVPASAVERLLRSFPGVASVRLDEVIHLPEVMAAGAAPVEWNIDAVRAPALWQMGINGSGIVVASMDSGVDFQHNDLAGRWRGGANSWFDPNGQHPAVPYDKSGHGTGTMGVMLGGDATGTAIGIAPGAQWIAVKIFNDAGDASTSVIHAGFQWLLDPDQNPATDDAPDIVNNSWGYDGLVNECMLEFQTDLQLLRAAGIAVVFSAGNEGPGPATSISPSNNPESFAVGMVSSTQDIVSLSSRGPGACDAADDAYPEAVAPGLSVRTAGLSLNGTLPNAYTVVTGTSFAAPHVSGALALLLEALPGTSVSELETALKQSAVDLGATGPDNDYGHGMIDVLAAYRLQAGCTDGDGDGYYLEAVCGTAQDCDDADAGIHPSSTEIKGDGVDQDCNGYDLSIVIGSAVYRVDTNVLKVHATSALAEAAALNLEGFGPMNWDNASNRWVMLVNAASDPGIVVVNGIEGAESSTTTACQNTCPADLNDDGTINLSDLVLLRSNYGEDCRQLPPQEQCIGDINGDLIVNLTDLVLLRKDYGRSNCLVCQ